MPEATEQQIVIDLMTELARQAVKWLPKWKKKAWRKAGGERVANVELWERLETAVTAHEEVRWKWVRGHAGHELNEQADYLAEAAARRSAAVKR